MKMIDLFAGIGGFSLAGHAAGFTTEVFVEKDSFCRKVLRKNFPGVYIHRNENEDELFFSLVKANRK